MGFTDLQDVLGTTPAKVLPIMGRKVAFPGRVSARTGMLLLSIQRDAVAQGGESGDVEATVEALGLTDEDAEQLEVELFGDGRAVLDELGVIGEARQLVMGTLVAWHLGGIEAAEATWEAGTGGKAPAPSNRATRRKTVGRSSKTAATAAGRSRAGAGAPSARRRPATGD